MDIMIKNEETGKWCMIQSNELEDVLNFAGAFKNYHSNEKSKNKSVNETINLIEKEVL